MNRNENVILELPVISTYDGAYTSNEQMRWSWLKNLEGDLKNHIRQCEAQLEMIEIWRSDAGRSVCQDCNGSGHIRVYTAQDEVHSERCSSCGGSGKPKEQD